MKYAIILAALALLAIWRLNSTPGVELPAPTAIPTQASAGETLPTVSVSGNTFSYALARVTTPITILPNVPEQKTFDTLVTENECAAAINGGFYQPDNTPLGWLVVGGQTITPPRPSPLFNGYLVIADSADIETQPSDTAQYGLQAGPMLLWNGEALPLRIRDDEGARRSVIATTDQGGIIFLSIFSPNQVFDGPYLADLPEIVSQINNELSLHIRNAMNLDGGSASAFYAGETRLGEFTDVGSVLCAQPAQ